VLVALEEVPCYGESPADDEAHSDGNDTNRGADNQLVYHWNRWV
jgi:hypothetical protein